MPRLARRSRLVAFGMSVGALVGLVTGMVATERVLPATAPMPTPVAVDEAGTLPAAPVGVPDPFASGEPATPPSRRPGGRARTITSAS